MKQGLSLTITANCDVAIVRRRSTEQTNIANSQNYTVPNKKAPVKLMTRAFGTL